MCSDYVNAGALGGIRGSLRRVANDLEQQNHAVSALARQVQIANQWQAEAFNLQKQLAEWQTWGRKMKVGWEQEEQVSADLRQQLEQAQEALRAENSRGNRCARKLNVLLEYANNVRARPNDAVSLTSELKATLVAMDSQPK
jgi:DNA anti-recombination protein RmuC